MNKEDEDSHDEDGGGLLAVKAKTAQEEAAEEARYEAWLQGEGKSFDSKTQVCPCNDLNAIVRICHINRFGGLLNTFKMNSTLFVCCCLFA